jgi:hypothetical protein
MMELKREVVEKGLKGGILSDFVGFIEYWGGCVGFDAGRQEKQKKFSVGKLGWLGRGV